MELIAVDDVQALSGASEHLAGASLEIPRDGARRDEWWLPLAGWVVGRHEEVTSVEVVQQDARVGSVPVDLRRADVAAAHPGAPGAERAGFSLRLGAVALPERFVLRVEAGFANGHRVPFAVIRGRRAPLPAPAADGTIPPIAVTALPRSGATIVMAMLARHPEVVVAGEHPYPARPAAYWAHMLSVLSAPADQRQSAHPDTFDSSRHWVGHHPLNASPLTDAPEVAAWFGRDYVADLAAFAVRSASELYARVAAARGIAAPRFYAEKREPGAIARLAAELHPAAREIIVVRDFRDMTCSMLAFAARHGEPAPSSGERFVLSLVPALARLVAYVHERGEAALVVRYEDLITRPARTFERILGHLGLTCSRRQLRAIAAEAGAPSPQLDAHGTSSALHSSIGRHLEDMDAELLGAAELAFAPALESFGYRRAVTPAAV